jgi:hypothetical protein
MPHDREVLAPAMGFAAFTLAYLRKGRDNPYVSGDDIRALRIDIQNIDVPSISEINKTLSADPSDWEVPEDWEVPKIDSSKLTIPKT